MLVKKNECKSCGYKGSGYYCENCSQAYDTRRITLHSLIHEVFHFFTHLEKGFLYTLKQLIVSPGKTQRKYIEGERVRHQKPFSMFFICTTIAALALYGINKIITTYYDAGEIAEVNFFNSYLVITQIVLVPVYALITYLIFLKSKYNYAEVAILILYSSSIFFFIVVIIHLFKFIHPDLKTEFIELSVVAFYNTITCVNFFRGNRKWVIILKSLIGVIICFLIAHYAQKLVIGLLS